ncbi:MAG TPA: extracellular solute-binding protein, partial [Candidatus Atribacteria bacterium]|nr:extracellular solute-binding protein [Candidatus Atribacteria bacterium]
YYKDKLYMIPMYNYAMGLIYRKDLLNDPVLKKRWKEEYGTELTLPDSVEDYVELAAFMQKNAGVYGSAMQAQRGDPIVMEWCNYLFSVGGDFYDANWIPIINNEKGVKAVELYKKALKTAAPPGALSFNLDDSFRIMSQGKAFSMITYNWMLAQLDDPNFSKVAGKVALAPMPGGIGLNGGWGWAIPKNSTHKKEAWEFIKWVESFEIAKKRALLGGAPTRKDIFSDKDVIAKYPWYKDVEKLLAQAKPVPEFQYSAQMIEVTGRELSLACAGQKDVKKALDAISKELLKLAKQAGLTK